MPEPNTFYRCPECGREFPCDVHNPRQLCPKCAVTLQLWETRPLSHAEAIQLADAIKDGRFLKQEDKCQPES